MATRSLLVRQRRNLGSCLHSIDRFSISSVNRRLLSIVKTSKRGRENRRKNSLTKRKTSRPMTVKDRIRSRQKPPNTSLIMQNEELIAERMATRLEWAQKSIFKALWSPAQSTKEKTTARRHEVVMDANWWFWNLLLVSSPSILIAAYCEFVAKPEMARQASLGKQVIGSTGTDSSTSATTSVFENLSVNTSDAWNLLIQWWQGKTTLDTKAIEADDSSAANQGERRQAQPTSNALLTSNSKDNPQLQKLDQLKQQIMELEQEIRGKNINNSPESNDKHNNDTIMSPIHRRRLDRQVHKSSTMQSQSSEADQFSSGTTVRSMEQNAEVKQESNSDSETTNQANLEDKLAIPLNIWRKIQAGSKWLYNKSIGDFRAKGEKENGESPNDTN